MRMRPGEGHHVVNIQIPGVRVDFTGIRVIPATVGHGASGLCKLHRRSREFLKQLMARILTVPVLIDPVIVEVAVIWNAHI